MKLLNLLLAAALAAVAGCDGDDRDDVTPRVNGVASHADAAPSTYPSTRAQAPRVVFLGDSLTAGYGLEAGEAFPAIVERMLKDEGIEVRVVNAGVSGDTTAGGVSRLDWLLRQSPDVVVVGLGANDGLRGLDVKASEQNLRAIIKRCRAAGAEVLLLGMIMPPNYGPQYTSEFRAIYPRLAKEMNVGLVPFLLEGVGGVPELNQGDGIHPTAEGHRRVAKNVLPELREILAAREADAREP